MITISLQFFGGRGSAGGGKSGGGSSSQAPNRLQQVQGMNSAEFEGYLTELHKSQASNLDSSYNYSKDSDFQKMVADLDLNDKPAVVDTKTFDAILASNPDVKVIYRGVSDTGAITADGILDQIKFSDGFHIGGGYYGDGLYFAGDANTAHDYATWGGKVQRAALSPEAKVISKSRLDTERRKLDLSTRQALRKSGDTSPGNWNNWGQALLAAKLGYDAIEGGDRDHLIIINRRALIIDNHNYDRQKVVSAHQKMLRNPKTRTHEYTSIKDIPHNNSNQ